MNDPAKPDTPTKAEHDAWVDANGRSYTQRPLKRRKPNIDGYVNEGEGK